MRICRGWNDVAPIPRPDVGLLLCLEQVNCFMMTMATTWLIVHGVDDNVIRFTNGSVGIDDLNIGLGSGLKLHVDDEYGLVMITGVGVVLGIRFGGSYSRGVVLEYDDLSDALSKVREFLEVVSACPRDPA